MGVATAAGAAAPYIDKLDFLVRQPSSIILPPTPNIATQGGLEIAIDPVNNIISVVNPPPTGFTARELYSAISDKFDETAMMTFKFPMMPHTKNVMSMENGWSLAPPALKGVRKGTILASKGDYSQSLIDLGVPEKPKNFLDVNGKISWVTKYLDATG